MNETRVVTRTATDEDLQRILAIDDLPTRADLIRRAVAESRCVTVESDGIIVGFALPGEFYGFDFLELLVVASEYRRRGIGSALVDAWERSAETPKLFTSTNESNIPMQRLCEKSGFVRSGSVENLDEGDREIIYFKPNPNRTGGEAS